MNAGFRNAGAGEEDFVKKEFVGFEDASYLIRMNVTFNGSCDVGKTHYYRFPFYHVVEA